MPVTAVVVAGLGYAGLQLAMRAVAVGHDVVGYDTDLVRVKRLEVGESYVEDVAAGELAAALEPGGSGRRSARPPVRASTSP
jgi:UDP-N-acetyl-D-glucosamine dehydrogenase